MRWDCDDRLHNIHFVTLGFADQKHTMALVTLLAACIYLASIANALAVTHSSKDSEPAIDLGYSKYRGVRHPGGVDQFLGMRYAQAPVGELRFRAPREPEYKYEEQDASQVGYVGSNTGAWTNPTCFIIVWRSLPGYRTATWQWSR
jgi:hypothetical protein